MNKLENLKCLANTLMYCAEQCDLLEGEYYKGKADAFRIATEWLMEDIVYYEKENA